MSGEADHLQIVRAFYTAQAAGDWDAAFANVAPDLEWEPDPRHPEAGVHQGRDRFRAFVEDFDDLFEEASTEPEQLFARGDAVVAFVRIRRRPAGGAEEVQIRIGELWTLRDGQVVRWQGFGEREKALEAAGLTPADEFPTA